MLIFRVSPISYSCTRKKMFHCLCTATSETQFCYYETSKVLANSAC